MRPWPSLEVLDLGYAWTELEEEKRAVKAAEGQWGNFGFELLIWDVDVK